MSIITKFSGSSQLPQFLVQFSPFETEDCPLASCRFDLYDSMTGLPDGLEKITSVGVHSFYKSPKGVVISDGRAYAEVHLSDRTVSVRYPSDKQYPETQTAFLMQQAYRYIAADSGQLQMHGAVVMYRGAGITFCGISGAGKSTQAGLWETLRQAEVLNYDQPVLCFDGDDVIACGSPWGGKERHCVNRSVPLKAIFYVEQAKENTVVRMSAAEGFSHLFVHNYLIPIFPETDRRHSETVEKIALRIPIYRLKCTVSEDAVNAVHRILFGDMQ